MWRGGENSLKDERAAGGGLMADRCGSYYSRITQGEGGADPAFAQWEHLPAPDSSNGAKHKKHEQSHDVKSGVPALTACQNKIIN